MRTDSFHYELPPELIAQQPASHRTEARLLRLHGPHGALSDGFIPDIAALLNPGDLLVFNDTRVIPARLFGHKASGGRVELLIERVGADGEALAHIKASKSPRANSTITLDGGHRIRVIGRDGDLYRIVSDSNADIATIMQSVGHVPLPPYIDRADTDIDVERYQTVYGCNPGAVAAPTAGLHFDTALLEQLKAQGVEFGHVTLHVGAGTFQPVRVDEIGAHQMHKEYFEVSATLVAQAQQARAEGKRVVAVGTTSVRALESASLAGSLQAHSGETDIFIYPGYAFKSVDALLTNFHLPQSTLLMLVSAFAGSENIKRAYAHAIAERYRFFSYGDAMWIAPQE